MTAAMYAGSKAGPSGPNQRRVVDPGPPMGVSCDKAVVSVALQLPGVVLVPAVGMHVAAVLPSGVEPLRNWTVPVGPAPLLPVPVTVAVRVTMPPEATEVALDVTTVDVTVVPPEVTLKVLAGAVEPA